MFETEWTSISFIPSDIERSITAIPSFLATSLVVIVGLIYKIHARPLGRMVLVMNVTHTMYYFVRLSSLITQPTNNFSCRLVVAIVLFLLVSSLLWGTFFGHAIYIITKRQSMQILATAFKWYLVIAAAFSGGIALVSILLDLVIYSESEGCVHRIYPDKVDVPFLIAPTLPITLCVILSVVWSLLTGFAAKSHYMNVKAKDLFVLRVYPAIVIFCWLPILLYGTAANLGLQTSDTVHVILINLFLLQGFFDALVYGLAPRIIQYFYKQTESVASSNTLLMATSPAFSAEDNDLKKSELSCISSSDF